MSRKIRLPVTYKQLCILKHALRDKKYRDIDEEMLFKNLSQAVAQFKEINNIPDREFKNNKTDINHAPVKGSSRKVLK